MCAAAVRTLVDMIADRGEHFDDHYYVGDDDSSTRMMAVLPQLLQVRWWMGR